MSIKVQHEGMRIELPCVVIELLTDVHMMSTGSAPSGSLDLKGISKVAGEIVQRIEHLSCTSYIGWIPAPYEKWFLSIEQGINFEHNQVWPTYQNQIQINQKNTHRAL